MNSQLERHLADAMYALNKALDHTGRVKDRQQVLFLRDRIADLRMANDPSLKL